MGQLVWNLFIENGINMGADGAQTLRRNANSKCRRIWMKKCAFLIIRERTCIGRSIHVIHGNSLDIMFHLTRCPLGKESVGKHAVVGKTRRQSL